MRYDYAALRPVDAGRFTSITVAPELLERDYARSDDEDMARIERFLDLAEGSLRARGPYYLKIDDCDHCGRAMKVSDFVLTALLDAGHPREFVVQVLLGDKKIVQQARRVRCSACGTVSAGKAQYWMNDYACDDQKG